MSTPSWFSCAFGVGVAAMFGAVLGWPAACAVLASFGFGWFAGSYDESDPDVD